MTNVYRLRDVIAWARREAGNPRSDLDDPLRRYSVRMMLLASAAEKSLPPPVTKWVERWHVEFCHMGEPHVGLYEHYAAAKNRRDELERSDEISCIRITGPHKHEVTE